MNKKNQSGAPYSQALRRYARASNSAAGTILTAADPAAVITTAAPCEVLKIQDKRLTLRGAAKCAVSNAAEGAGNTVTVQLEYQVTEDGIPGGWLPLGPPQARTCAVADAANQADVQGEALIVFGGANNSVELRATGVASNSDGEVGKDALTLILELWSAS